MKHYNYSGVASIFVLASALSVFSTSVNGDSAVERAKYFTHPVCPVTGNELSAREHPIQDVYDGRQVGFCSERCPKVFEENLEENLQKLDKAIIQGQAQVYPKGNCVVNDEPLSDSLDSTVNFVFGNLLIRLDSPDCRKRFEANPETYLLELERRAVSEQLPEYPLDVCIVSGDKLNSEEAKPVNYVLGHRLIRFCTLCEKYCAPKVRENPARYFRLIETARTDPNFPPKSHKGFHTLEELRREAESKESAERDN